MKTPGDTAGLPDPAEGAALLAAAVNAASEAAPTRQSTRPTAAMISGSRRSPIRAASRRAAQARPNP